MRLFKALSTIAILFSTSLSRASDQEYKEEFKCFLAFGHLTAPENGNDGMALLFSEKPWSANEKPNPKVLYVYRYVEDGVSFHRIPVRNYRFDFAIASPAGTRYAVDVAKGAKETGGSTIKAVRYETADTSRWPRLKPSPALTGDARHEALFLLKKELLSDLNRNKNCIKGVMETDEERSLDPGRQPDPITARDRLAAAESMQNKLYSCSSVGDSFIKPHIVDFQATLNNGLASLRQKVRWENYKDERTASPRECE